MPKICLEEEDKKAEKWQPQKSFAKISRDVWKEAPDCNYVILIKNPLERILHFLNSIMR